jgi:hypothetical protein
MYDYDTCLINLIHPPVLLVFLQWMLEEDLACDDTAA